MNDKEKDYKIRIRVCEPRIDTGSTYISPRSPLSFNIDYSFFIRYLNLHYLSDIFFQSIEKDPSQERINENEIIISLKIKFF